MATEPEDLYEKNEKLLTALEFDLTEMREVLGTATKMIAMGVNQQERESGLTALCAMALERRLQCMQIAIVQAIDRSNITAEMDELSESIRESRS
jgi:hypothetical protein